jgi:hypothetical protein
MARTIKLLQNATHTLTQGPRKIETTALKAGETFELPNRVHGFRDQIESEAEWNDRTISEYGFNPDGSQASQAEIVAASERLARGDYGQVYETV